MSVVVTVSIIIGGVGGDGDISTIRGGRLKTGCKHHGIKGWMGGGIHFYFFY